MSDASLMSAVFIGIIAGFYLLFMRPIAKEQQKHKQQIRDLRAGDEVLTTSGFVATVRDIRVTDEGQTRIQLQLADNVVVTALSSSIAQRLTPASAAAANPEQKEASA